MISAEQYKLLCDIRGRVDNENAAFLCDEAWEEMLVLGFVKKISGSRYVGFLGYVAITFKGRVVLAAYEEQNAPRKNS